MPNIGYRKVSYRIKVVCNYLSGLTWDPGILKIEEI